MTTNFAGWEQISKKLDRLFNQYGVTEDIPNNADIAEFFKTAEFNTIYRARPNRGILNTCIPNTSYSFYIREANNIVGYDTQGNLYIGGFVNLSFIGWRQIAMSDEHHIKTYTTLEQLNLSDDEMSDTDYDSNLMRIVKALPNQSILMLFSGDAPNPNLATSIVKKVSDDGIYNITGTKFNTMLIHKTYGGNSPVKIEMLFETGALREKMIYCAYNADGGVANIYLFREVAKTEIFRETIVPLNGWDLTNGYVSKVGNQVSINATMTGGIRTSGTTIFTMPSDYLPIGQAIFPVVSNSNNHLGRVVALKNGEFKVYGLEDSSDLLCFSGTYTVA